MRAQSLLSDAGAEVESVELPAEFDDLVGGEGKLLSDLTFAEGYVNLLREYRTDPSKLDPIFNDWFENKRQHTPRQMSNMRDQLAALRPIFDELARKYDAVITPSVPGEAPKGLGYTGDARFCSLWTGLHVPAINIPGFAGDNGLPIGLTLVSARSVVLFSGCGHLG